MTDKLKSKAPCELNPNCGSSDAYSEYIINGVKRGKCFSCGWSKTLGTSNEINTRAAVDHFPLPYSANDIEAMHMLYPLFDIHLLTKYRIQLKTDQYHDRYIYLPSYLDGEFRGYQIKQLDRSPKYLSYVNEPLIYYTKQKTEHCETLVITEDWLSALATSTVSGIEGLAVATSSFSITGAVYKFIDKIRPDLIIIWLDDDIAGRFGARKIDRLLSNLYLTKIVYSKKEPKECTLEELKGILHAD